MIYNIMGMHVVSALIMIDTKSWFIGSMDFGLDLRLCMTVFYMKIT